MSFYKMSQRYVCQFQDFKKSFQIKFKKGRNLSAAVSPLKGYRLLRREFSFFLHKRFLTINIILRRYLKYEKLCLQQKNMQE